VERHDQSQPQIIACHIKAQTAEVASMSNVIYFTCRTLASSPDFNGFRHIADVGWMREIGQTGVADLQRIVTWLEESPNNEAYSRAANGQTARVHVQHSGHHKYIEMYLDATKADNLHELPNC
jgi:Protein of unknown function (DUF3892)